MNIYNSGQIIDASGNATVNVTQNNNKLYEEDLDSIINEITMNLFDLNTENQKIILEAINTIKGETKKGNPEKTVLEKCSDTIKTIKNIAINAPVLYEGLQKLYSIIQTYVK